MKAQITGHCFYKVFL